MATVYCRVIFAVEMDSNCAASPTTASGTAIDPRWRYYPGSLWRRGFRNRAIPLDMSNMERSVVLVPTASSGLQSAGTTRKDAV